MIAAFVAGGLAGYAIAIPVGAVAVLIIETGLRHGFRLAVTAGAGVASADGLWALVAAVFGTAVAQVLAPWVVPLQVIAVVALLAIAAKAVIAAGRLRPVDPDTALPTDLARAEDTESAPRTYAAFLGLTLLNPTTVTYFVALIIGLAPTGTGPADKAAFVVGAFLASLSWQTTLAVAGTVLHRRVSLRARRIVMLCGSGLITAFAVLIAVDIWRG